MLISPDPCSWGECVIPQQASIFVVEDHPGVCEAIVISLEDLGFLVSGFSATGEDAIDQIARLKPDLILMDINLAGEMDGIEAACRIRDDFFIPVVFLTGNDDDALNPRITASGSYGYLVKPYDEQELQLTIEIAIYKHQMDLCISRSEQFYRTLAEALDDGIILIDQNGEIRYMNTVARKLIQLISPGEHPPQTDYPLHEINPGVFREEVLQIMGGIFTSGKPIQKVTAIPSPDQDFWLELHMLPVSHNGEVSRGILLIIRDVTLQMEFEMEVRKAGLSRIEENMEKFQILNDQIRNPLQVLTGLVDLEESPQKSRFMEQIETIDQVIHDFDEAWVRSEKVRRFLLTHYGHGVFFKNKEFN